MALAHTPPIAAPRDASSPAAPGGRPRSGTSGADRKTETGSTERETAEDGSADPVRRRFRARVHDDLATVAPAWRAMQADGACTPYQRFAWVALVVEHLAAGVTPLFVEVLDTAAGRPVLILPMVRIRRRTHTAVEWLDLGVSDYAAPVMAAGRALAADEAARAWDAVRAVLPPADLIRITRIPESVFGAPNPLARVGSARPLALSSSGVALVGDPDTLLRRVCTPSTVRDVAKRRRRLAERGEVRFAAAATETEVEAMFGTLLRQRRDRFHDMGRFDLLDRPEVTAFYRAAARRGLAEGSVRVFALTVGDEAIATAYGLVAGNTFHGVLLAMGGEAWRSFGPGIMIVSEIMVWARGQGMIALDFTVGALPYKHSFRPTEHPLFEIAEARTAIGHLVLGLARVATGAKAFLERHPATFERLRAGRQFARRLANGARARLGRG